MSDLDPWKAFYADCVCECPQPQCPYRVGSARYMVSAVLQSISIKDLNDNCKRFIPRGDIIRHFGLDRVSHLLGTLLGQRESFSAGDDVDKSILAAYVCPPKGECHCGDASCTGARLLFVALVLMAKESEILEFYKHAKGKCDKTLSIRHIPQASVETHDAFSPIRDWSADDKDLFCHAQWPLRPPYFQSLGLSELSDLVLDDEVSLPWIKSEALRRIRTNETGSRRSMKSGIHAQSSTINKIKIHPQQHDFELDDQFALKIFTKTIIADLDEKRFHAEVEANKRLRQPHKRIVPLLSAFKHRGISHLVFPWAMHGNLKDLWKRSTPSDDIHWFSYDWLWEQCLGLADALAFTHGLTTSANGERAKAQVHADISADNILVFSNGTNDENERILKLSDFGLSREVDSNGRLAANTLKHTRTNAPPERELSEHQASPQWDIWVLGCLYVDFITWGLSGYHGVKTFATSREQELDDPRVLKAQGVRIRDTWFRQASTRPWLAWIPGYHLKTTFHVKKAVLQHIVHLQNHPRCNNRLSAFLDYIIHNMIVVNDGNRATALDVKAFLSEH